MDLKCTLLREKGQSENATFSDSNYVAFWKWQNYEDKERSEVSRSLRRGREGRGWTFRAVKLFCMTLCVLQDTSAGQGRTSLNKRRLWGREDRKTWLLYWISPKFETVLRNNLLKMIFLGFYTRPAQAESWGGLGSDMHTFPCRINHGL